MILDKRKNILEKQGYRVIGNHSAVKICLYCKKAIRGDDICYKNQFYGIKSWRCVQMTPVIDNCTHRCEWCWRDIEYSSLKLKNVDKPKDIIEGCIKAHKEILQGFGGNANISKKRFKEAMNPLHFAISLTGEPTLYPQLPKLISEIRDRGMTSFLVTNGTNPIMLKKLLKNQPTQLYITLPAPNEEIYQKVCNPLIKDGWKKIQKSLELLGKFERGTIRMTLVKHMNMIYPEQYNTLLKNINFKFLELKAGMPVGYARYRMKYEEMPLHKDVVIFSKKISEATGLKMIDEKENSRVILLTNENKNKRLDFDRD